MGKVFGVSLPQASISHTVSMINRKTAVNHITEACREEFTSNNGNLSAAEGQQMIPCCDYQWLITLSGHQSRNALTGALSWCWALPKLRLGLSPEGQWMGNSWLLSNPLLKTHPNYSPHLLFILSFWLSICFWCRQWLYTGTLLHLPAFAEAFTLGHLEG